MIDPIVVDWFLLDSIPNNHFFTTDTDHDTILICNFNISHCSFMPFHILSTPIIIIPKSNLAIVESYGSFAFLQRSNAINYAAAFFVLFVLNTRLSI